MVGELAWLQIALSDKWPTVIVTAVFVCLELHYVLITSRRRRFEKNGSRLAFMCLFNVYLYWKSMQHEAMPHVTVFIAYTSLQSLSLKGLL